MTNKPNKELFESLKEFHTGDGGNAPDEYAVTELIKKSIINRDYKIYNGGGYDINEDPIMNFDVVVWFSMPGDPYFMVCMDNSEGDHGDFYRCNENGELEMKRF
jgi:hypothetical protein